MRTRHTVDTMKVELETARRVGSMAEMNDLMLLIRNASQFRGAPALPGAIAARNRQNQRRHTRARRYERETTKAPLVGRWVRCLDGTVTCIEAVDGDVYFCEGGITVMADSVTPVDGPVRRVGDYVPPVPLPAPAQGVPAYAEALYQAAWDALEKADWAALEAALRAFEATAPAT
jgi:hypothetical protein